jgi:hypothetical protein
MFPHLAVLTLLLAAAFVCNVQSVSAQIDPNVYPAAPLTQFNFGMIGLTRGQTARLNVTYDHVVSIDPSLHNPPGDIPPDPYRVTLSFVNRDGRVVAQNVVLLAMGKAALLDFSAVDLNFTRTAVRAVVDVDGHDANGNNRVLLPAVLPSVEVFNNDNGQTSALDPGSISSFSPQPDAPGFGMFGLARNHTARINVAYVGTHNPPGLHNPPGDVPPDPCRVTMRFVNGDGRVMAENTQMVEFGKSAFFDFPTRAVAAGARQRLRAVVIVDPNIRGIAPCVMPSLEVFNNDTGKTTVFYPGSLLGW